MAGNTAIIDEVVAPVAITQFTELTVASKAATDQMVLALQAAIALNNATGGSQNIIVFKNNAQAAALATQSLIKAQNEAATSAVKLQQAHNQLATQTARQEVASKRAADAAQKALSPYQQLSKQLEILRAHAKDVGVQFGEHSKQFKEASKPVQELDARLKGLDQTLGQSQRNVGNYGNAFRGVLNAYIPFGDATLKVGENLKTLAADVTGSEEGVSALAETLGAFGVGAFVLAIGSATYYLSQFKSTGDKVSEVMAGLKTSFATFGEGIVNKLTGTKTEDEKADEKAFSKMSIWDRIKSQFTTKGTVVDSFNKGEDAQKKILALQNATEIDEINNSTLKSEAEKNRALSTDRKLDIADRISYLKSAEKIEQNILDNKKENADLTINTAIQLGNKLGTLSKKQINELQDAAKQGNLKPAQNLALNGQQFTEEGFELYKKGVEKQIEYKQSVTNQIIQLQADADNMQLKSDRALAQAQERLDKARLAGQLDKSKLILDNEKATYGEKTKANEDFINSSLKLAKVERDNQLGAAGLGGRGGADSRTEHVTRLAIEQEYQNQLNKIRAEGLGNTQKIQKAVSEELRKELEDMIRNNEDAEKLALQGLQDSNEKQITLIQGQADKEMAAVASKYERHKISEQKYQREITRIQDQALVDRLGQEAFYAQSVLEIKQAAENAAIANLQGQGGQEAIDRIKANSGVAGAQNAVDKAGQALQNGLNKQTQDNAKPDKGKDAITAIKEAEQLQEGLQSLVDKGYENQIAHLEKIGKLIDENAQIEKDAIDRSLDTQANKARRQAILEAQTASEKRALAEKEAQLKTKEAKADKVASMARIVEETAVKVIEYGGFTPLAILAASIGAVQLGIAAATPIPTYAKGTGTGSHQGGLLIYGEKGSERVDLPSGQTYYSPGVATMANLPRGTKITPHNMLPETPKWTSNRSDNSDVVAAVNENTRAVKQSQPKQGPQRLSGWVVEQRRADAWNSYSQNHFK